MSPEYISIIQPGFQFYEALLHLDFSCNRIESLADGVFSNQVYITRHLSKKELSSCKKLLFLNFYICATRCCRPLIIQTMNSVESNSLSLKYQRSTSSSCKDIGIRKVKFVKFIKSLAFFPFWVASKVGL